MRFITTRVRQWAQSCLLLVLMSLGWPSAQANLVSSVISSSGMGSFCDITAQGVVRCWGTGHIGQLGSGQFLEQMTPVPVVGVQGRAKQVVADYGRACVLLEGGRVNCWGGLKANNAEPVSTDEEARLQSVASQVLGLPPDVDLLLSPLCARSPSQGQFCWAASGFPFQAVSTPFPAELQWLQTATEIQWPYYDRVCGRAASGVWRCTGYSNGYGALSPSIPVDVGATPYTGDVQLPSGQVVGLWLTPDRGCASNDENALWCWGRAFGSTVTGERYVVNPMVQRRAAWQTVVQVVGGLQYQCALDRAGQVWCWGLNTYGQLGVGGVASSDQPLQVQGLPGPVQALAPVDDGICARLVSGAVVCWGRMLAPDVGAVPRLISRDGVVDVSAVGGGACTLHEGGQVRCWGYGVSRPVGDQGWWPVEGLPAVTQLSGNCALDTQGQPWCWDGRMVAEPGPALVQPAIALALSAFTKCVITVDRTVMCWGRSSRGELGQQGFTEQSTPIAITGLRGPVLALAAGYQHFCATLVEGGVQCWGWDQYDQLGDGDNNWFPERLGGPSPHSAVPVDVVGTSGLVWSSVAANYSGTCATALDGRMLCWGRTQRFEGQVAGSPAWAQAATGGYLGLQRLGMASDHGCALDAQSRVWCWGGNDYAELGNGEHRLQRTWTYCIPSRYSVCYGSNDEFASVKSAPIQPVGLTQAMRQVRTFGAGACAVTDTGELWCWGMGLVLPDWRLGSAVPRAITAEVVVSSEDRVFNYLQAVAPSILFPPSHQTLNRDGFAYRAYHDNTVISAKDGRLYYAGPLMADGSLADLGELSFWLTRAAEAGY